MSEIPVGYRFYPTEEELIFFLHQKLEGAQLDLDRLIPVLDIYDYNPWDLPQHSGDVCRGDTQLKEWYFFIPAQEREARGGRPNRLTQTGYWKATGSPGWVFSSDNRIIAGKRTMVFYMGRSPTGRKTHWKMNEYRATDHLHQQRPRVEFSVCRVYTESKCVRSYDRRPAAAGVVLGSRSPAIQSPPDHHQHVQSMQRPPIAIMEGTSSGDHSGSDDSSGGGEDDQRPSQSFGGNDGHFGVEIDNFPLWEWDENWNLL
ncbi:hypothetical protein Ancab_031591 [Ancistrocladus abbreviatus]